MDSPLWIAQLGAQLLRLEQCVLGGSRDRGCSGRKWRRTLVDGARAGCIRGSHAGLLLSVGIGAVQSSCDPGGPSGVGGASSGRCAAASAERSARARLASARRSAKLAGSPGPVNEALGQCLLITTPTERASRAAARAARPPSAGRPCTGPQDAMREPQCHRSRSIVRSGAFSLCGATPAGGEVARMSSANAWTSPDHGTPLARGPDFAGQRDPEAARFTNPRARSAPSESAA
jgi:hypothetical protein